MEPAKNLLGKAAKVATPVERALLLSNNHAAANGVWRNVGIAFGRGAPDAAVAKDYRALLEQLIKSNPQGVGLITVIQPNSTPTPDGRDAMVKMFRDLWPNIRGAAFVVEARGFAAATQRSVLSAFLMATRLNARLKIFDSIESAAPWLASVLVDAGKVPSTELSLALFEAVTEFCGRYRK